MLGLSTSIKAIVLMLIVCGITLLIIRLFYYIAVMIDSWEELRKNKEPDKVIENKKIYVKENNESKEE